MSIHGICFDNGQSGNCNCDCEQFLEGGCAASSDIIDNAVRAGFSTEDIAEWCALYKPKEGE